MVVARKKFAMPTVTRTLKLPNTGLQWLKTQIIKEFVNNLISFWYPTSPTPCMYLVCKHLLYTAVCPEAPANHSTSTFRKYLNYGLKSWLSDNKEVNGGHREVNKTSNVRALLLHNGGLRHVN